MRLVTSSKKITFLIGRQRSFRVSRVKDHAHGEETWNRYTSVRCAALRSTLFFHEDNKTGCVKMRRVAFVFPSWSPSLSQARSDQRCCSCQSRVFKRDRFFEGSSANHGSNASRKWRELLSYISMASHENGKLPSSPHKNKSRSIGNQTTLYIKEGLVTQFHPDTAHNTNEDVRREGPREPIR